MENNISYLPAMTVNLKYEVDNTLFINLIFSNLIGQFTIDMVELLLHQCIID